MNCKVSHQLYVNKSLSLWNNFHSSRLPGRIFVCSDNFLVMQTKHSMLVRNKACRQYLNIPVFVGEPSEYSILDILLGRTIYVIKTLQLPSPAKSCSRVLVATYYQLVIIHKNSGQPRLYQHTSHVTPAVASNTRLSTLSTEMRRKWEWEWSWPACPSSEPLLQWLQHCRLPSVIIQTPEPLTSSLPCDWRLWARRSWHCEG